MNPASQVPSQLRVFVNGAAVDVAKGAVALDAVRNWNSESATEVESGLSSLTDSRGLPLAPDSTLVNGAIIRVIVVRTRSLKSTAATDTLDSNQ